MTPNVDEYDPLPDELQETPNNLQPQEMFDDDQLADLQDEPPDEVPLLESLAPESEIAEPTNAEAAADDATGLHCSTRTQAQPSSYIPSFTGNR